MEVGSHNSQSSGDSKSIAVSEKTSDNSTDIQAVQREYHRKREAILEACDSTDLDAISNLATTSGGLLTDALRQRAWPILLGCGSAPQSLSVSTGPPPVYAENTRENWKTFARHRDEDQVELDVNRSFVFYPQDESQIQLESRRAELSDVIIETLRRHPMLCYFQGFHDIVQVMLLVLGKDAAAVAVPHLSLLRIRDFLLPSMSASLAHLQLLPAILSSADRKLCKHLAGTRPFFALAATLTLYSHDVEDYSDISRLFDFFLAHEAAVSLYLFAVIILERRKELLEIPADEPELLHFTLSKLPRPLDLEKLISKTIDLFNAHPPERLPFRAWSKVSSYSVLKTTRASSHSVSTPGAVLPVNPSQALVAGENLFALQAIQIARDEQFEQMLALVWKHRKPVSGALLAVLIGVVSIAMQKSGFEFSTKSSGWLWSFADIWRNTLFQ